VRAGAEQAVVRAAVVRDGRTAVLEVEINPGRTNRARVNRAQLPRPRELIGLVRSVVFSPDDLTLVKGDPGDRRRFLDDLMVLRQPRLAGVKADYDRVLKQRNSLLKTARLAKGPAREGMLATLGVWDDHLVAAGTEIIAARHALVDALLPHLGTAYAAVARGATREDLLAAYVPIVETDWDPGPSDPVRRSSEVETIAAAFRDRLAARQADELDRGLTLVGPHRDELALTLGESLGDGELRLPVKGYASHGEMWSTALALKLASYELLRAEGDDPILILDDVFAELDATRREHLADLVAGAEQVLVTAAVGADVPPQLAGARFQVAAGSVTPDD